MWSISFAGLQRPAWQQRSCWMTVVLMITLLAATSQAVGGQWQMLFDGTNLDGWKPSRENKQFELVDGVILGSSSGQTQFLHTEKEYGDFELEFEVKVHDMDLNSGVQIRTSLIRVNERGDERPSVHGPQVDLGKSPGRSGYIFNQGNGSWVTPEADLVRNSLMINGEWNKVRVLAVGRRIQTWINGEQVSDLAVPGEIYERYSKGVIALQVHGVRDPEEKTRHVSFRSIRIRRIESAK
jgi:hypothetical protein